jgi:CxxC-x17-CxxC domain-containing protein
MHKFKRNNDFKKERPFHKEFVPGRPLHKKFDRSAPRFGDDRPPRRFSRDEGRGRTLEMTDAVCDKCGKECQVPFRPTRGKPIYCRDCFNKGESAEPRRSEPRAEMPENKSDDLQQINRKLDKIMKALKIN